MGKFILAGFGDEIAPELDTQLEVMKKNGIRALELRSIEGKNVSDFTPAEAKGLKEKLDAAGFTVSSAASPIGKIGVRDPFEKHLGLFENTLEVARILGAPFLRIFSFYIPAGETPQTCRDTVLERLSRLCDAAKGSGVRLLHENELGIYGDTPERCLDLLEALGYNRMGAVFDPANFINLTRRVEVYPYAWNVLKKYVDYLHIKDAIHIDDPKENHHEVRPAGYGDGRIEEILRDLKASGYEGVLSVEPHLGYFPGLEKLEKRGISDMPQGGPRTFSIAAAALSALIEKIG